MNEPVATGSTLPPEAYERMAKVLRAGLLVSAVLLAVGLPLYLWDHPAISLTQVLAQNPIGGYLSGQGLLGGLLAGHVQALLTVALVVLVATPLLRVATGWYYFHKVGDHPLARISAVVLTLLLAGILVLGPLLR